MPICLLETGRVAVATGCNPGDLSRGVTAVTQTRTMFLFKVNESWRFRNTPPPVRKLPTPTLQLMENPSKEHVLTAHTVYVGWSPNVALHQSPFQTCINCVVVVPLLQNAVVPSEILVSKYNMSAIESSNYLSQTDKLHVLPADSSQP